MHNNFIKISQQDWMSQTSTKLGKRSTRYEASSLSCFRSTLEIDYDIYNKVKNEIYNKNLPKKWQRKSRIKESKKPINDQNFQNLYSYPCFCGIPVSVNSYFNYDDFYEQANCAVTYYGRTNASDEPYQRGRTMFEKMWTKKLPKGINMIEHQVNKIMIYEFLPVGFSKKTKADKYDIPLMIYWHGGGGVFRRPNKEYVRFLGRLAEVLKIRVVAPAYDRAPEIIFPNGIGDAVDACIDFLRGTYDQSATMRQPFNPQKFFLGGDSGGTLGVNLLLHMLASDENLSSKFKPFATIVNTSASNSCFYDFPSYHDVKALRGMTLARKHYFQNCHINGLEFVRHCRGVESTNSASSASKFDGGAYCENHYQYTIGLGLAQNEECKHLFNLEAYDMEKYLPNEFRTGPYKVDNSELYHKKYNREQHKKDLEANANLNLPKWIFSEIENHNKKGLQDFRSNFFNAGKDILLNIVRAFPNNVFYFSAAEYDIFRDEGVMFGNRLVELGANVMIEVVDRVLHSYPVYSKFMGGFNRSFDAETLVWITNIGYLIEMNSVDQENRGSVL